MMVRRWASIVSGVWCGVVLMSGVALGQGAALRAVSPISEGMAGAVTAAPVDAAGAIYWNPGSISGIRGDDVSINFGSIWSVSALGSTMNTPYGTFSGETKSDGGAIPTPSMALVKHIRDTPFTVGLGIGGIAGAKCNYTGSGSLIDTTGLPNYDANPILSNSNLGHLAAEVMVFQMAPTVSMRLNEYLSIGVAPTVTMANINASPLFLAPTDSAGQWPDGSGSHYTWGAGFQTGVYLRTPANWDFGLSFKSPQWMRDFHFNYAGEDGGTTYRYSLDYPMIISVGTAYRGIERWLFTADVRYFNWSGVDGFGDAGTDHGLSWDDSVSFSVSATHQLTERLALRCGYCYATPAIDDDATLYNIGSSLTMEHSAHVGTTIDLGEQWLVSGSYTYVFEDENRGPLSVTNPSLGEVWTKSAAHAAWLGVSKRF
ncbi:MAG: outer membrane protein transport protein [Planctomycetia bacterium]|nr:outer membrane protein transport protein [Planctomycetia bacterium]